MINILNKLSFANYGMVLDKPVSTADKNFNNFNKIVLIQKNRFYFSKESVYINPIHGTTILRVKHKIDSNKIKSFHFDKPIKIDANIVFQIVPFDSEHAIKLYMPNDTILSSVGVFEKDLQYKIESHMNLNEISTLFYQEEEKGFYFETESHNKYELLYTDIGKMHCVINGKDYTLEQGDLIICGPRQRRMQYAEKNCRASFITITFNWKYKYTTSVLNKIIKIENSMAILIKGIIEEHQKQDFLSDDIILCYLKTLLLFLMRQIHNNKKPKKMLKPITINNENQIINNAITYIQNNLSENLTVKQIASVLYISPSYLTAIFSKNIRISPGRYISKKKLEEGKRLIREGKLNFTEISKRIGYANVHYFSNQFKATYGITPTEYSKSVR